MPNPDLIRFLDAQDDVYHQVVAELTNGSSGPTGCGSFSRMKRHGAAIRANPPTRLQHVELARILDG